MIEVIKAPQKVNYSRKKTIFLAGSIEMGLAEDWQTYVTNKLDKSYRVLNPRREEWDDSWEQSINNEKFYEQVTWELEGLDKSDAIIMYFSPQTKSPISLLELGLYAETGKIFVCCPERFYRKGNVDIVCERYLIPLYTNLEDLINENFTE